MAVVIPVDFAKEVSVLIALADHPRDVATTTDYDGVLAVIVPDELLARYETYTSLSESSSPKEPKRKGTKS
jgi:hypothetical protein